LGAPPLFSLRSGKHIPVNMRFISILIAASVWLDVGLAARGTDPGIGITLYGGYA
jgi:hypothetical protein